MIHLLYHVLVSIGLGCALFTLACYIFGLETWTAPKDTAIMSVMSAIIFVCYGIAMLLSSKFTNSRK